MDPTPNKSETPTQTSKLEDHSHSSQSSEYVPYPKLDPNDVAPPAPATETWTSVPVGSEAPPPPPPPPPPAPAPQPASLPIKEDAAASSFSNSTPRSPDFAHGPAAPISASSATTMPSESNPYVSPAPAQPPGSSMKKQIDSVKEVLEKFGKKAAEATKKGQDVAGNMWQHLKTGPSFADAAVGRIAQGTKVLAEGGYEKVFRQSFETVPEEKLLKSYACYLSTSAGPVMGTLYLSTEKLAFCSDNPLSYKVGEEVQWSYYKVVLPVNQLKAVNPSTSKVNAAEKYIQIISVDSHEFWFMGFVYYDSAVKNLQGALIVPHSA